MEGTLASKPKQVPARPYLPDDFEWISIIQPSDLVGLASGAKLVIRADPGHLNAIASMMNEALYRACHASMIEPQRNYSDVAAWSSEVGSLADRLAKLMLSATPADGPAPFDALEWFKPAFPSRSKVEAGLDELLAMAVPGETDRSTEAQIHDLVARLRPSLLVVRVLAGAAQAHWMSKIKRGGKATDSVRRDLMLEISNGYHSLFGEWPTVTTSQTRSGPRTTVKSGKSVHWFTSLFASVETRLPIVQSTERLRLLLRQARGSTDTLDGWIRNAAKERKSNPNNEF